MNNLIIVSEENLKGKFWKKPENVLFAKNASAVPVSLEEIANLCLYLPLVFVKQQNGKYNLMALFNLINKGNLFVSPDGKWLGRAMPYFFVGYPFVLAKNEKNEPVLLVNEGLVTTNSKDNPFFNKKGKFHPELQNIVNFLFKREKGYELTFNICQRIAELGLLEPWELEINIGEKQEKIEGLYRINVEKYTKLADKQVIELKNIGAFILIYGHLFSLANIEVLKGLLNK